RVVAESKKAFVLLKPVGDHLLLIKSQSNGDYPRVIGELKEITPEINQHIIEPILTDVPALKDRILPYMLDASDYRRDAYLLLCICLPLLLIGIWTLILLQKRRNSLAHPIIRTLAEYGDPIEIAKGIDQEFSSGRRTFGGVTLTFSWLLKP